MKNAFLLLFFALLLSGCASTCKKAGDGTVQVQGYIVSLSSDSFPHYYVQTESGEKFRLKYSEVSGLNDTVAGKNTGHLVMVTGLLDGKTLTVTKFERVE